MLQLIKRHLPETIKGHIRQAFSHFEKPVLSYLEFHLTDHCNLDCKGCGHFCPIAAPEYARIDQHETDMRRLGQLFSNIRTIRLMGGEPLLHPEAVSFIEVTRRYFPHADIRLVTNGILLPSVADAFWQACRNTRTVIDLSLYPPLKPRARDLHLLCNEKGVVLNPSEVEVFYAGMNLKGDSDVGKTFSACRKRFLCPFLQNGMLYPCAAPAVIQHFNDRFNYNIPAGAGIDIHARSMTGSKALKLLELPISNCKFCSVDTVPFKWDRSSRSLEEWDVNAQVNLSEN